MSAAEEIADDEIVPREELTRTDTTERGPIYACPRCGYEWVAEYCDCPECGWAGMCQEGFDA